MIIANAQQPLPSPEAGDLTHLVLRKIELVLNEPRLLLLHLHDELDAAGVQYALAVTLLSTRTEGEERCHITLLPIEDAHDFFSAHSSDYASGDFYSGQWC